MNRLESELQRLFLLQGAGGGTTAASGPDGRTRAPVLGLAGADSWGALRTVWQGVQADLQLPAPAISVGAGGFQLWFSLAQPVAAAQALLFLQRLRGRYLGELAPERIVMQPAAGSTQAAATVRLPPCELAPDRWSAFVAPDLAGLFEDEPWLDLAPSPDAQADLLCLLHSAPPAAFDAALDRLAPAADAPPAAPPPAAPPPAGSAPASPAVAREHDPRRFLLAVMNDPAVDLRLRIEAAKALLPHGEGERAR